MSRKLKLASVTWRDTCTHHGSFASEEVEKLKTMVVHSAGYLVQTNKKCIRLANEVFEKADGRCREVEIIDRRNILKMTVHTIEVEEN